VFALRTIWSSDDPFSHLDADGLRPVVKYIALPNLAARIVRPAPARQACIRPPFDADCRGRWSC
jgi:hypothetical protein